MAIAGNRSGVPGAPNEGCARFALWLRDAYGCAGVAFAKAEKQRIELELEEKARLRLV